MSATNLLLAFIHLRKAKNKRNQQQRRKKQQQKSEWIERHVCVE